MEVLPDAIFVVDAVSNDTAVREANKMGITLFGLCDTNSDPSLFDYPIPANDDGIKSINLICETVIRSFGEGKKEEINSQAARIREEEQAKKVQDEAELAEPVAEETAVIEEEVEKEVLEESARKV